MARQFLPVGYFRDNATVYTENPSTGAFDVVAKSGLACRLNEVNRQAAATGPDRVELAAIRELHSDPTYAIPAYSRLAIGGKTWVPNPRTIVLETHHDGSALWYRSDLTEAAS